MCIGEVSIGEVSIGEVSISEVSIFAPIHVRVPQRVDIGEFAGSEHARRIAAAMVMIMTELIDGAKTDEALSLIDHHLGDLRRRELVSSNEVSDLLLDLRMLLTYEASEPVEPASVN